MDTHYKAGRSFALKGWKDSGRALGAYMYQSGAMCFWPERDADFLRGFQSV